MKYRKETWVTWGGDGHLAFTGIKAENAKPDWDCDKVVLLRIEAANHTRKRGQLVFTFSTPRFDGLRDGELALLHPAIDRWLHRFKNVAPISSPSCNHAFTVNVVNDKGFCETIVELVSELVKDLDLDNYGWFYTRFNLKQLTYVRVGEEWVDFERHILSKYPVEKK